MFFNEQQDESRNTSQLFNSIVVHDGVFLIFIMGVLVFGRWGDGYYVSNLPMSDI